MYNCSFTIASLIILCFLLFHYRRNRADENPESHFFRSYIIFALGVSCLDLLDVALLRIPDTPTMACTVVCALYLVVETNAIAHLSATLPVLIRDPTSREKRNWKLLMLPVLLVDVLLLVVNFPTGVIFSISPTHYYVTGPAHAILNICDLWFLLSIGACYVINRHRIDEDHLTTALSMMVIATVGLVAQWIFWDIRLTPFVITFIILEMYLGFQIPEKRYDRLTGLRTRASFYTATQTMLSAHPDIRYVLVYTNIEQFKAINDIYGTAKGDQVLAEVAHTLNARISGVGTAGRLQGDHFAFCVPADRFDPEHLVRATSRNLILEHFGCEVRFIFGICYIEDERTSISAACDHARLAMREIADSQVEQYAIYRPDQRERFLSDRETNLQMESALREGQFVVFLQPIVRLETGEVCAAEALVRWIHPEKGLISPDRFIPLFEHNGLITELDHFVWESVCSQLSRWREAGCRLLPVSVNISAADLKPGLGRYLVELTDRYGVEHSQLKLEITESAYAAYRNHLRSFIDYLHGRGFQVMMDDFGTGYSSLQLLKDASFDELKIDREFLMRIQDDERTRIVVSSTIALARELDVTVVAEGIETAEQASTLSSMGAVEGQGYYFARPMSITDFEERFLRPAQMETETETAQI